MALSIDQEQTRAAFQSPLGLEIDDPLPTTVAREMPGHDADKRLRS